MRKNKNLTSFFVLSIFLTNIFLINIKWNYNVKIVFSIKFYYFLLNKIPNKSFGLFHIFHQNSRCKLCSYEVKSINSNSNNNDIILGSVLKQYRNFFPLIQTLRSVKCKAVFFVFFDERSFSKLPYIFINEFENCGVNLIKIGNLRIESIKVLQFYRYFIYNLFLKEKKCNRILSIDMYDTLFQGDPFNDKIFEDKIYFTLENARFKDNVVNMRWIKRITNKTANLQYNEKTIINGGTIIGGYIPYLVFLEIFLTITNFPKVLDQPVDDQGFINIIFYDGLLNMKSVKSDILSPLDGFGNIFCMTNLKINWTFPNIMYPKSKIFFYIVHQIYRKQNICHSFLKICPPINDFYSKNDYLKCQR